MKVRLFGKFAAGLALVATCLSGCVVDTDYLSEEGVFFCESDTDCDPGFECNAQSSACVRRGAVVDAECVDEDGDGYGVGEDRRKCNFPEPDNDDTDKSIYPGAPDICDGKDNDVDPNTADGQIACETVIDCPSQVATQLGGFFSCESELCVLRARKAVGVCENRSFGCQSGAYEEIPEECR